MIDFSATITCDRCGSSQTFDLVGINTIRTELIAAAERSAWECDGEDLCANCVSIGEWEAEDDTEREKWTG